MKYLGVVVVFVMLLHACTSRHVEPSKSSRKAIDTIYQQKTLALLPAMDSFCRVMEDSLFRTAVDSILEVRRSEMIDLVQ